MTFAPIRIDISQEMLKKARERDNGKMNGRSFMNGYGNFIGFLGEYIVHSVRPDFKHLDSYDYDFLMGNQKIDVKTKKQTVNQTPLSTWEASIDVNSLHQDANYYIFCRILKVGDEYPWGWILGGISKSDYINKARKLTKGDLDGDNGFRVKQDCLNLEYSKLRQIKID